MIIRCGFNDVWLLRTSPDYEESVADVSICNMQKVKAGREGGEGAGPPPTILITISAVPIFA